MDTKYLTKEKVLNFGAKDIQKYSYEQINYFLRFVTDIEDIVVNEIFYNCDFNEETIQLIYHHISDETTIFNVIGKNLSQISNEIINNKKRIYKARYDASKRTIQDIMYGLVNDLRNSVFEINSVEDYISFKEALSEMDNIVLSHYRKEESNDQ